MAQIEIDLLVDANKALQSIKGFSSQANKELSSIKFTSLITSFATVGSAAASAGRLLLNALQEPINAAVEQENAINSLNSALKQNQNFSVETSKALQDYASALQSTTKIADEVTLSNLALLQSLAPLTKDGLIAANNAAANLSAALRIDLESAVRLVGKAANGNIEAFKRYGIELKKGANDSETFTTALDALEKKFGGAAQNEVNTFSGALAQSRNAFGEVLEEIGNIVIQTPEFVQLIKDSAKGFLELALAIKDAAPALKDFISGFINLVGTSFGDAFGALGSIFSKISDGAKSAAQSVGLLAINSEKIKSEELKELFGSSSVDDFATSLDKASNAASDLKKNLFLKEQFKDFLPDLKKLEDTLKNSGLNGLEVARKLRSERLSLITDAVKAEQLGIKQSASLRKSIEIDFQKSRIEFEKKLADEQAKSVQRQVDDASALVNLLEGKGRGAGQQGNASNVKGGDALAITSAVAAQNLLKGSEGAVNVLKAGLGSAATAALGPIGQVLGPIISDIAGSLAQGPAKVREMVASFIQSIPTIIENIILSIPVLIETIIENVPLIIEKLIEQIPRVITEGLLPRIPEIITKLIEGAIKAGIQFAIQMPAVATQLGISLAAQAPMIAIKTVDAFVAEAPRFISELIKSLPSAISGVGGSLGGLAGGLGGALGIGDVFGFAEGGRVPDSSKFMGDRFPARLNAGEQVLDRDLSKQLETFLDGRSQSQGPSTMNVTLQVGEKQLASVLLDLTRGGFRTV